MRVGGRSLLASALLTACVPDGPGGRDDDDKGPAVVDGVFTLPPLAAAPTTAEQTLVPAHAPADELGRNPAEPESQAHYLEQGFGDVVTGPADPAVFRTLDGQVPPFRGDHPRRLARFVHLADIQLMDDESPIRTAVFDGVSRTSGALRPQDPAVCRMLNAAVRTINALHGRDPIDFVLLGGDNADSAQENEVRWVIDILSGGDVECDSGADDDVVAGEGNDGKDPFHSAGLAMPWKWVSGNHDVNVQGNFGVDDEQRASALGTHSEFGTRDYAFRRGGAVRQGDFVIADERRRLLLGPDLLELVGDHGDGHGLRDADRAHGKAFHSFDVGDFLTFVVLDTNAAAGGASGQLSRADVDRFVVPALDDAKARGRAVVLASHHALDSLTKDGGPFGSTVDDALLPDEWKSFLAGYPNVVLSMVAHTHRHRVLVQETAPQQAFFEVMTSALADFPHQFRVIEIWDDDNGTLRVEAVPVDFAVDDDDVAAAGRALGVIDQLSGYTFFDGRGDDGDRNVTLVVPKPVF